MARKQYWNSEAKNARWIKQGRGKGAGHDYKPWLTVRDVPSEGRVHRVFGHLTKRTHHLLSDLELATFLMLQWRETTTDIREQFPLERALTEQISNEMGVLHPAQKGILQYMSSDFLVNSEERHLPVFALQVKPSSKLCDPRTVEKLEIERRYWKHKEIPWFIVTEEQIPRIVFENIDWLYNLQSEQDNEEEGVVHQLELYSEWLKKYPNLKLIELCKKLDVAYSLELGESLFQIRNLLAKRYFHFDITIPFKELRCQDLRSESQDAVLEFINVSSQ